MLRGMDTTSPAPSDNELVSTAFEACSAFADRGDGAPVCGACGWLDTEHPESHPDAGAAEVRVLTRRRRPAPGRVVGGRIAS